MKQYQLFVTMKDNPSNPAEECTYVYDQRSAEQQARAAAGFAKMGPKSVHFITLVTNNKITLTIRP